MVEITVSNADELLTALSGATGGETILLEFLLSSDGFGNYAGWYLDDVVVQITPGTAPLITTQPLASLSIIPGNGAGLSVAATGDPEPIYQWHEGTSGDTSNPIPGANSNSFVSPALFSSTHYWVRVTDADGFVDSDTATVTVEGELPGAHTVPLTRVYPSAGGGSSPSLGALLPV